MTRTFTDAEARYLAKSTDAADAQRRLKILDRPAPVLDAVPNGPVDLNSPALRAAVRRVTSDFGTLEEQRWQAKQNLIAAGNAAPTFEQIVAESTRIGKSRAEADRKADAAEAKERAEDERAYQRSIRSGR